MALREPISGYQLSRSWFDWSFENPEKVSPNHSAIFFFAIEHCNRLGWKDKFGFPTQMVMDAIGIKKHQTYIRYFNDLVEWGFFDLVQKSQNQYSANIISLQCAMPKNGKALDKAFITHAAKQVANNGQSNSSIDKPINQITNNNITNGTKIFGSNNKYYFNVDKKYLTDKATRVNIDGLKDYFEWNESVLNLPAFAEKFMRKHNGAKFNDFMHVFNAYNKFTENGNA